LRQKLRRRGFPIDEVEGALGRLIDLGYLDDAAFARGLVRRRSSSRGLLALSAELAAKGIDRAGAAAALSAFDPQAQLTAAVGLAQRLAGHLLAEGQRPSYEQVLARVGPKLQRRGFSTHVVVAACRTLVSGAARQAGD
jgi:regulatory protein